MAIGFTGPFVAATELGIRINTSPSLPLGLYRGTSDPHARLVEFCPEEPYARFAIERGYRSAGNCPDGAAPLMKPVVADAGDIVNVSQAGISVNGNLLPNTAPKRMDRRNRLMPAGPLGTCRVSAGFVWVASSYNSWSYDSRYFGSIPLSSIRNYMEPFFVL
jgi:conjugative transfer signal peptidase TraF